MIGPRASGARRALVPLLAALALLPVTTLFILGCNCKTFRKDTTVELADDEMDLPCEEICGEIVSPFGDLVGCTKGTSNTGAPAVVCSFETEACSSGGL